MYQYELVVVLCCITHIHSSYRSAIAVSSIEDSRIQRQGWRQSGERVVLVLRDKDRSGLEWERSF